MASTPPEKAETSNPSPQSRLRLPVSYLAFWGVAACTSAIYLAISITQPEMLNGMSRSADTNPPATNPQTSAFQGVDDILSDAQMELAKERAKMSREAERKAAETKQTEETSPPEQHSQNTNALEQQYSVPGIIVSVPTAPAQNATATGSSNIQTGSTAQSLTADTSAPDTSPTVINEPTNQPQAETKTATPAEIAAAQKAAVPVPPIPTRAPAPPVNITRVVDSAKSATAAATQQTAPVVPIRLGDANASGPLIGVRLGTGPSIEALRLTWSYLLENHQPTLQGLEPRYFLSPAQEDAFGPTYALVAGPIGSEAQAKNVCLSLVARGMKCEISLYGGTAL